MKIKKLFYLLFNYDKYHALIRAEDRQYFINNPMPTGICYGCGKDIFNSEETCSDICKEIVELQLSGYN